PGGRLHLNIAIAHPDHAYQVVLSVRDAHGDVARATLDAEAPPRASGADPRPGLAVKDQPESGYAVGDTVTTTMSDGRGALPSGGSNAYLFLTAQRGLRDVFAEVYNSDDLLLPEECEFQKYRMLIQRIADATKVSKDEPHKGRILRGVIADLLGHREL
ncbi:MAG: hypothetical protein LAO07_11520, partial [Acidobacteriia bacterium]|nr:hypothetical protein [Terriglobia bacterium]